MLTSRSVVFSLFVVLVVLPACQSDKVITTNSHEARVLYDRGVVLLESFYYREAADTFALATSLDSSFAMAWARRAYIAMDFDGQPRARLLIAKAEQFASNVSRREQQYIRLWRHLIEFDSRLATRVCDSLLAEYPHEAEACVFRGRMYEREKKLDEAIKIYQRALEITPDYPPAVMQLGYVYSSAADHVKALEMMKKYISLVPGFADPRASYADLLMRVGRYSEALEQYQLSLDIKPDYWYSHSQIGHIYELMGRLKEAQAEYKLSLAAIGDSSRRDNLLKGIQGSIAMKRGEYEKAIQYFTEVAASDSDGFQGKWGLMAAHMKLGRLDEAETNLTKFRMLIEDMGLSGTVTMLEYYTSAAELALARNLHESAVALCDSALQFSTPLTRPAVFKVIAGVHLSRKEFEEAIDACDEALSQNPHDPSSLLTLLEVYRESGDRVMTNEIGQRLLDFWRDADDDFVDLAKAKSLLRPSTRRAI